MFKVFDPPGYTLYISSFSVLNSYHLIEVGISRVGTQASPSGYDLSLSTRCLDPTQPEFTRGLACYISTMWVVDLPKVNKKFQIWSGRSPTIWSLGRPVNPLLLFFSLKLQIKNPKKT